MDCNFCDEKPTRENKTITYSENKTGKLFNICLNCSAKYSRYLCVYATNKNI